MFKFYLILFTLICIKSSETKQEISAKLSQVWGPGLEPHLITMPARYFFIQAVDHHENIIFTDLDSASFEIAVEGGSNNQKPCRIWTNILNRRNGSFIVRYKLYETCTNLKISIKHQNQHVAQSPYVINSAVYPEDCDCPTGTIEEFLRNWKCGTVPKQIISDLKPYKSVNWGQIRRKVIKTFDQPHSISLCHFIVSSNQIYRKCYGKYVGFKMFMDSILLSLTRKMYLPDLEFFVNLGDWPLVNDKVADFPIFSWCGSTSTHDIIMPTYDITESTLENMGRVMLDMLSVQGNVKEIWENRIEKAFWRGRDSNQFRLDLIDISRQYPDLFNVSLTNFFFFRDKQERYGPKADYVSFFSFFDYKYQLGLDGTVAAYRLPYLLAGGSLVIKQESHYYEHFYNDLIPNTHYVPIKRDLSDLVETINWAKNNDKEAQRIAKNGQDFANENLLPQQIFCYYSHLLNEFSKIMKSKVTIFEEMENVPQIKQQNSCDCNINKAKDEL